MTGTGDALPTPVAAVLATVAGILLVPAFPPRGWWWLAIVATAASCLAARGRRPRTGALLGLLTGLGFFLPHLHWSGVYVGALPWVALAVLETLFFGLAGALLPGVWLAAARLREVTAAFAVVLGTAGIWVAQEALRSRVPFGGFPWGRIAFSQADAVTVRWAWLGGAPLVTGVVAGLGGALAVLIVWLAGHLRRPPATSAAGLWRPARPAAVAALACFVLLPAAAVLPVVGPDDAQGRRVRVAAVQGDVPEAGLEFNAERRAVLDNHVAGTLGLARRVAAGETPAPDLVLWPENSSDIDPLRSPDAAGVIQQAADAVGVPVLVGAVLREPEGHLSNAGIVWLPTVSGHPGPGARYVKKHPAPFAEYIPARSFFRRFSEKVDLVRTDFAPGRLSGALRAGPAVVGDVICFEVAYDGIVRQAVRDGADLLVVQTNNATFGYTDESVQQLAMSRLRAVETGRAVVHVSTVGVSGLYAPDGTELARSGHFTPEVLEATLPLHRSLTPAVRAGVAPEIALALLGLLIALGGFAATRRERRTAVPGSVRS